MNKEITCRLIDGKPVVKVVDVYIPGKGDITVGILNGEKFYIWVEGIEGCYAQAWAGFKLNGESDFGVSSPVGMGIWETRKATPEESEVMLHILHENGYDLIGTEVVKKRWVPKIGEEYWYVTRRNGIFMIGKGVNRDMPQYSYDHCFKTERACQCACDKLNELLLTFPQE